ncbi:hypothetical protein AC579_9801 [Pseudocercospora musae]|uniref:F-box domain-containing protein n=1 Tax=Pseudocercospora musae TaxID=113226 RepID=A0A139IV56_9PEZI|nr:hypothetical protein AC579_9801 [Pseudocercospora musae]
MLFFTLLVLTAAASAGVAGGRHPGQHEGKRPTSVRSAHEAHLPTGVRSYPHPTHIAQDARSGFGANTPSKAGRHPNKKFKPTEAAAWPRMTARAVSYWDSLVSGTNKRVSKAVANAKAQQTGSLAHNREALARMGPRPKNAPRDVQDDDEEYEELHDGDDDDYVASIQRRDLEDGVPEDVEPSEDRYTELEDDDTTTGEQVEDLTTTSRMRYAAKMAKRNADDDDFGDDQFYDDRHDSLDEDAMNAYVDADDGDDEQLQKRHPSYHVKQKSSQRGGGGRGSATHMKHPRDVDEEEDEDCIEARDAKKCKGKDRSHRSFKNMGRSDSKEDIDHVAKIKARGARKPYHVVGTSPPLPTEAPTVTTAAPKIAPAASITGVSKKHKPHGKGRHPKHGASAKSERSPAHPMCLQVVEIDDPIILSLSQGTVSRASVLQPEDLKSMNYEIVLNPMIVKSSTKWDDPMSLAFHQCAPYKDHFLHTELLDVPMDASCRQIFITQPLLLFATSAIAIKYKWYSRIVSWKEASPSRYRKVLGGGHKFGEVLEQLTGESIRPTEEICPRTHWTITWTGEAPTCKNRAENLCWMRETLVGPKRASCCEDFTKRRTCNPDPVQFCARLSIVRKIALQRFEKSFCLSQALPNQFLQLHTRNTHILMADQDSIEDVSSIATAAQPISMAAVPPDSAATKVFGVVELAEQILLELKTEDLFRAQRVCRQWKAVIGSSSPCRKALFLEPGSAEDVNVDDVHRFVMQWWQRDIEKFGGCEELAACENGIMFNPLLVKTLAGHPGKIYTLMAFNDSRYTSSLYPNLLNVCEDASCGRMFLSQPPLQFMTSGIDLENKPLSKSEQNDVRFTIAQGIWTPKEFLTVDERFSTEACELGQGTTLGGLRHTLRASLRDCERISADALWTFSWAGLSDHPAARRGQAHLTVERCNRPICELCGQAGNSH